MEPIKTKNTVRKLQNETDYQKWKYEIEMALRMKESWMPVKYASVEQFVLFEEKGNPTKVKSEATREECYVELIAADLVQDEGLEDYEHKWRKKNYSAVAIIGASVGEKFQRAVIENSNSAFDIWRAIEEKCLPQQTAITTTMRDQFYSVKQQQKESIRKSR